MTEMGVNPTGVALVTGGSRGLGFEMSRAFAQAGATTIISSRKQAGCDEAAAAIREETGQDSLPVACHVGDWDDCDRLVETCYDRLGRIDVLVNNAGMSPVYDSLSSISRELWDKVIAVNLTGTYLCAQAQAQQFLRQEPTEGKIVNIASIEGSRPATGHSHYSTSKSALIMATRAAALELGKHGIRVNSIAPGVIVTSGTKQYPPELLDNAEKSNPLKRLGTAEEVSHLITYMVSRYADFITGQTFYIDGGASIWGEQWFLPEDLPKYPPYPVPGRD